MHRADWLSHLVSVAGIALILTGCGDDSTGGTDSGPTDSGPLVQPDAGHDAAMMTPMKGPPLSDDYTLEACPGAAPVSMIELFDVLPDCSDICGGGRCVPSALAGGASSQASILPDCADGMSKCIPLDIAASGGNFKFQPCTSPLDIPDMKGACVPICLVGAMSSFLMKDTCGEGELCAP